MRTSQTGLNLIKMFESLHDGDLTQIGLQPKMDPIGIWTEGYGRAMRNAKGEFIKGKDKRQEAFDNITIHTVEEANKALLEDLQSREYGTMQKVKVPLNQNQFDALVSHRYNTGGSNTLYSLINSKATDKSIRIWFETKYITADGIIMKGLIRRRKAEANLFFMPIE